jgi:hypothetical protein
MQDVQRSGRKVDIAYYNKASQQLLSSLELHDRYDLPEALAGVKMLIGKKGLSWTGDIPLTTSCPIYLSNALLGTRAIFHLLLGRPCQLSVYGFDFYYAETSHYAGDLNELHRTSKGVFRTNSNMCDALGRHHPVSQLRFVRNLWRAGVLTPHGRTAEVLSMTDLEYATGLEERYSQW